MVILILKLFYMEDKKMKLFKKKAKEIGFSTATTPAASDGKVKDNSPTFIGSLEFVQEAQKQIEKK